MDKARPEHYPAKLYAAVHTGNHGDIEFYIKACKDTGTVLELGCGTGRVARRLIEAGHAVVGVDVDVDALAIASRLGVHTVATDFTHFALDRHFERIIIPYNGFYCLLSEEAMVTCLRSVERHLTTDGMLVFDVFSADQIAIGTSEPGGDDWVATAYCEGRHWEVYENANIDPHSQHIETTYHHRANEDGECIVATLHSRYLLSHQVPELLSQAGLTLAALHGNFDEEPYHYESDYLIVRATR